MSEERDLKDDILRAMAHRLKNGGRHLHHRHCIHNLPPEEQAALRRRTPEEYVALHGRMPVQITPSDWEIESPFGATPPSEPPLTVTEAIAAARALDLRPHDARVVDAIDRAVTGSSGQEPETFADRLSRQSIEAMEAQIAVDWDARNAREHAAGEHPADCTCQSAGPSEPPPQVECPHWTPGRITLRSGCTACEASGSSDQARHSKR